MHIVMISDVYFPRVNGVSTSIRTFRRELLALGHQVTLIAPDYGAVTDDESWIIRIPSRVVYVDPEDRMMRFSAIMALEEKLRQLEPDIIHIQTPFIAHYAGVKLAKRLRVPTVLTYHTFFEEYLYHYIRFLPKALLRWSVRHLTRQQCNDVNAVVVPTHAFNEVLTHYGVRAERYINPTGIDISRFSHGDGSRFKSKYGIEQNTPCLVFVGRMVHEKNIGFLLKVVAELQKRIPDILFILAGEGPAEDSIEEQGRELGIEHNLRFIGNLSVLQELLDCYSAGDAFIFASRTETQGLVLLEAMALGVPVVSTAVMGTADILKPGRGALVSIEDVETFANLVERLLSDKQLHQRLSREARNYAMEWSASAMARRLEAVYQDSTEAFSFLGEVVRSQE